MPSSPHIVFPLEFVSAAVLLDMSNIHEHAMLGGIPTHWNRLKFQHFTQVCGTLRCTYLVRGLGSPLKSPL